MGIYIFKAEDARDFARQMGIRTFERGDELHFQRCPYCHGGGSGKDKRTFSIHLTDGRFQCMRASCGAKGNMITLARDFNFSLGRDVDEYYGRKERYKNMKKYPRPLSKAPAVAYMETRGISRETTEAYAITTQRDRDNVLVFPFFDENGDMQFAKYRKTDFDSSRDSCKEWCEANCRPILFGMDKCDSAVSDTLVMTEGQIDSLSCVEAGIPNAVSVPTGKNGFTWVPHCWNFMAKYKTLIVFGDYEHGEITLLAEMKIRFRGAVKHVRKEDYRGCKDANELLQKHGAQAVRDAVAHAVPVANSRIIELADTECPYEDNLSFDSGIKELDKLAGGILEGYVYILTGECGKGKSTFGSQLIVRALAAGKNTFIYSGEMPKWDVRKWLDRQIAGPDHVTTRELHNGAIRYEVTREDVWPVHQWYRGRGRGYDNSIVGDDDEEHETLLETLKAAILQYGSEVLLVDNLMTAMNDDLGADFYRQQTRFVKALANLAQAYQVVIILVAHPRKSDGRNFRNDDISGSSNIANLAGMVMQYTDPVDEKDPGDRILRVTKNRINGRIHKGIPLWYDEASMRISDVQGHFSWNYSWTTDHVVDSASEDLELSFE